MVEVREGVAVELQEDVRDLAGVVHAVVMTGFGHAGLGRVAELGPGRPQSDSPPGERVVERVAPVHRKVRAAEREAA